MTFSRRDGPSKVPTFLEFLQEFSASLPLDRRLYYHDIRGSQAHCRMLARQGIISDEEADRILQGLEEVLQEIEAGQFPFAIEWEDIHMNVERRLMEKIGEVGGKLHTARSRNDQVALDERLFLADEIREILGLLLSLLETLVERAEACLKFIMPGYTHLQRAQPVLFSHHLMAYYEMFRRDRQRLEACLERVLDLPLGAGALAGVDFPVDRAFLAQELGFRSVCRNSIDAASDRDFIMEFLACSSILAVHLSRFCEELVMWSSQEFGFVRLGDLFCSGSSIMPQKRNPDLAELIRGKSGGVIGSLVSLLVTMKGLPLAYNKDMQEDKRPMFDAVDAVKGCLRVFIQMVRTMELDSGRMERATKEGHVTATDLANYLVEKGRPFRKAHGVVAEVVASCEERGIPLWGMELEELRRFDDAFGEDVYQVLDPRRSVERKVSFGGTATQRVSEALRQAKEEISRWKAPEGGVST